MIAGRNGAADISSFGESVEPVDASATSLEEEEVYTTYDIVQLRINT
jgi:hypothetical protein